jgi:chromate transporter
MITSASELSLCPRDDNRTAGQASKGIMVGDAGGKSATEPASPHQPAVSLVHIFLVFFQIGLFSFGGGLSGWMYQEMVVRRRWMSEDDFLSGLALCQVMPGINVSNIAVYIGQRLRGALGSCVALVGLLVGPFFVVIGLVVAYERIAGNTLVHAAMDGVAAAAIGLLLLVGYKGAQKSLKRPAAALVMAAIVAAVGLLEWPLVPVVLVLAPISVALAWPRAGHA